MRAAASHEPECKTCVVPVPHVHTFSLCILYKYVYIYIQYMMLYRVKISFSSQQVIRCYCATERSKSDCFFFLFLCTKEVHKGDACKTIWLQHCANIQNPLPTFCQHPSRIMWSPGILREIAATPTTMQTASLYDGSSCLLRQALQGIFCHLASLFLANWVPKINPRQ